MLRLYRSCNVKFSFIRAKNQKLSYFIESFQFFYSIKIRFYLISFTRLLFRKNSFTLFRVVSAILDRASSVRNA